MKGVPARSVNFVNVYLLNNDVEAPLLEERVSTNELKVLSGNVSDHPKNSDNSATQAPILRKDSESSSESGLSSGSKAVELVILSQDSNPSMQSWDKENQINTQNSGMKQEIVLEAQETSYEAKESLLNTKETLDTTKQASQETQEAQAPTAQIPVETHEIKKPSHKQNAASAPTSKTTNKVASTPTYHSKGLTAADYEEAWAIFWRR